MVLEDNVGDGLGYIFVLDKNGRYWCDRCDRDFIVGDERIYDDDLYKDEDENTELGFVDDEISSRTCYKPPLIARNPDYWIVENCPNCGIDAEIAWNVEEYGYKAFCPHCGEVLMICSECMEANNDCDWSGETGCRFHRKGENSVEKD